MRTSIGVCQDELSQIQTVARACGPARASGFTMVELMVVLAIMAILIGLAAPSFARLIQSNTISSSVNAFLSDMRYTRSEGIRLGGNTVLCRSDGPEAAEPVCGSGAGPGGSGWASGWLVFHDLNHDGNRQAGEPLLRVQPAIPGVGVIDDGGSSTQFRFSATGRLLNPGPATSLQFGSTAFSTDLRRVVCVGLGGRARVAGDASMSCGEDR